MAYATVLYFTVVIIEQGITDGHKFFSSVMSLCAYPSTALELIASGSQQEKSGALFNLQQIG